MSIYRLKSATVTDKRVKVMNELISGVRLIKMYAWEWAFREYVKEIRLLVILWFILYLIICYICTFSTGRKARLLLVLV